MATFLFSYRVPTDYDLGDGTKPGGYSMIIADLPADSEAQA